MQVRGQGGFPSENSAVILVTTHPTPQYQTAKRAFGKLLALIVLQVFLDFTKCRWSNSLHPAHPHIPHD